ncbi:MAG: hypothetical protein WCV71_02900 [Patescibacteria group bacterium]|jgi:hypothetical protein
MFKRINNWHLSALVAIVSIFSLVLIQQYVTAQGWTDPSDLPGGTPANNLVVTPMLQDLQLGAYDVAGANLRIDGNGTNVIQVSNGGKICFNGTADCASTWANNLWVTDINGIYYNGNVGIGGVPHVGFKLILKDVGGADLKLKSDTIWATATDLELQAANQVFTNNYFGIGTSNPNRQLHIVSAAGGQNAEIDIQSGADAYWGIYQDEATADLRFWNVNNRVTFADSGNVGIGTIDPSANLEIFGTQANQPTLKLHNSSGDVALSFQEYASLPSGSLGDITIRLNGNNPGINNGYANWLEFLGREPSQEGGHPIMTMQRDYITSGFPVGTTPTYHGVGIGVPSGTNITAKLRVQNYGPEDILQLYDNTTKVLTVADGGDMTITGNVNLNHGDLINGYNYLRLDHLVGSTAPLAADCDGTLVTKGRIIYDYTNDRLFVCDDDATWKSVVLN